MVYGISLDALKSNYGLIYEILKTLGHKMGIEELKEPEDISGVSIEKEYPDYIIEIKNGAIKILDFL
jgi:hypothetical protein